jgi:hypothetical protein
VVDDGLDDDYIMNDDIEAEPEYSEENSSTS